MTDIVILAAGKGTRMRSKLPKVLHKLAGKAFLQHVVDTSSQLSAEKIHIVVGHGAKEVQDSITGSNIRYVEQTEQLGTGHAVAQALEMLPDNRPVLILYGDVPLIQSSTLTALVGQVSERSMALLTFTLQDPTGYGRIVRNAENAITSIVEQKDANPEQLQINEINTGVMCVLGSHLKSWLPKLSNDNAQGEYYLTDLIEMAAQAGVDIKAEQPASELEITGVNNRLQQAELERAYQHQNAETLMEAGLSILDPKRFDLRGDLRHGEDCEIDINCIIEGKVEIGSNVSIGPNCLIKNSVIEDGVSIHANSIIEEAHIGSECNIGPFARLRPGTKLEHSARVGNFVETKKAHIGVGSKVNHLSYIGDAVVGNNVNIGAGTITCNYDGVNKSITQIGDESFIGSNSALVAPVSLSASTTVAAGSVVTSNSDEGQLVVARSKQRNINGWRRPVKKK